MFENGVYLLGGIVLGVMHHAYLQPRLSNAWAWIKAKAKEYGVGVRRDNG